MPPMLEANSVLATWLPDRASHNRKVLSSPAEINCSLVPAEKRTCLRPEVWPSKVTLASALASVAFSRSKMRSFLSLLPVARNSESDEKLTDLTMCLWLNVASSSPLTAFQILAEKSAAPEAALVALAFKSTPHTAPL